MSPFVQIVLAGVGTYLIRLSFIAFGDRLRRLPPRIELALSMIPPAVLASIAASSLLLDDGELRGLDEWHVAAVAAGLVAWRTKSVAWCLAVGMAIVWTVGP